MSDETTRTPDLYTALSIGIGSILTVVCMAYHPTTGAQDMEARLAEMCSEASVSAVVHGTLIAIMGALLAGFVGLARFLGWEHARARLGLVAYALAMLWLMGAALISGFVVSGVAAAYLGEPAEELAGLHQIFRLTWEMNQALARAGTVAWSLAIVFFSWLLFGRGKLATVCGALGLTAGVVPALGILSGSLTLHLHGMLAVVLIQAAWGVCLSVWMLRLRYDS